MYKQDYFQEEYMAEKKRICLRSFATLREQENPENSEGDVIICRTNKDIHHVHGRTVSRADTGYIHKA